MGWIIIPFSIIIVLAYVLPLILKGFNEKGGIETKPQNVRKYDREVDAIHITSDAESERHRRLDQLKSLYEAGMMESEEYYERKQEIEDDFHRNYR